MEVILAVEDIKDNQNEIITKECLVKCLEDFKELNVLLKYDYSKLIGKVTKLKLKDNKLIGEIKLDEDINYSDKIFWIGFVSNKSKLEGDVLIHNEIELMSVGMINKGADVYKEEYLKWKIEYVKHAIRI